MKVIVFLSIVLVSTISLGQNSMSLAVLKYSGGGDYYANPTALPNLIKFCNNSLSTKINEDVPYVEVGSKDLFLYPIYHNDLGKFPSRFFARPQDHYPQDLHVGYSFGMHWPSDYQWNLLR